MNIYNGVNSWLCIIKAKMTPNFQVMGMLEVILIRGIPPTSNTPFMVSIVTCYLDLRKVTTFYYKPSFSLRKDGMGRMDIIQ